MHKVTYSYAQAPYLVFARPLPHRGQIKVSWIPRPSPNGSNITDYVINYRPLFFGRLSFPWRYPTFNINVANNLTATPYTMSVILTNLTIGRRYWVGVGAKTELGLTRTSYGSTQVTTHNGKLAAKPKIYVFIQGNIVNKLSTC
jgi:hypothetical protein